MTHSKPRKPAAFRLHKPTGQGVVRLDGRDHYLGSHGSPVSHGRYERLVAEWLTAGTAAPVLAVPTPASASDPTVDAVVLASWRHAEVYYCRADGTTTAETSNIRDAVRPLRKLYGGTPAAAFGPLALRAVRDEMVRSGLARTTVNARINRVRRLFRWASSHEIIPPAVTTSLGAVEGLRPWRSAAPEPKPVAPVPAADVEACLPFLPRPVAAMVRLQLLLGCRTEEMLSIRGRDLDTSAPNWVYRPAGHKNAWRGQTRSVVLGPRAREILAEFLRDDPDQYLFSPGESVAARHARRTESRSSKPTPSELARRRGDALGGQHGVWYSRRSYRQAVVRACRKAGVAAWTPLQLRHTAATVIRGRYGVEAAQLILGYARVSTTELYAEKDLSRAHAIMVEMG